MALRSAISFFTLLGMRCTFLLSVYIFLTHCCEPIIYDAYSCDRKIP